MNESKITILKKVFHNQQKIKDQQDNIDRDDQFLLMTFIDGIKRKKKYTNEKYCTTIVECSAYNS